MTSLLHKQAAAFLTLAIALAACNERDRLTFPSNGPGGDDDQGPVTVIDNPSTDTTLDEGDAFVLSGRSLDTTGVDTVYFDVEGGGVNFLPLPGEGQDTVRFGLVIPTIGNLGQTITITVHAVDLRGNRGTTSIRRLSIR
jgi:hypothetical protein